MNDSTRSSSSPRRAQGARVASLLALVTVAGAAGACTSLLGGFDFEGTGGSSSSSSSSSGAACAEGVMACTSKSDCPGTATACAGPACVSGCCTVQNADVHTPVPGMDKVGDCHKAECDGMGQVVQVVDDTDVPDDGETCTTDACDNGAATHTPVAATLKCSENGGHVCGDPTTKAAGTCVGCNQNGDCTGGAVCAGNACVSPSCTDNMQDGDETDKDCGGSCPGCGDGQNCAKGADCQSLSCDANGKCAMATCSDNIKNDFETDGDCGGVMCLGCPAGKACKANSDCLGGVCTNNTCAPTCYDNQQNQGESDVDCGGPCAKKCDFGQGCVGPMDCVSGFCNANTGKCDAEVLAAGQSNPGAIAVDGTNVYWVAGGSGAIMKLAIGGTTPVPVATGAPYGGIAIDGTPSTTSQYVYWTEPGTNKVKRRKVDLSAAEETLASTQATPGAAIAVDAGGVYWANDGDGTVRKFNFANASVQTLATTGAPSPGGQQMVVSNGYVYWTSYTPQTLNRVPTTGTGAQLIIQPQQPAGLAADATNVYYTTTIFAFMKPIAGGMTQMLFGAATNLGAMSYDGTYLFTYENVPMTSQIYEFAPVTFQKKVLAKNMNAPGGIANDKFYVYFTNGDGTIRRVLK